MNIPISLDFVMQECFVWTLREHFSHVYFFLIGKNVGKFIFVV